MKVFLRLSFFRCGVRLTSEYTSNGVLPDAERRKRKSVDGCLSRDDLRDPRAVAAFHVVKKRPIERRQSKTMTGTQKISCREEWKRHYWHILECLSGSRCLRVGCRYYGKRDRRLERTANGCFGSVEKGYIYMLAYVDIHVYVCLCGHVSTNRRVEERACAAATERERAWELNGVYYYYYYCTIA